ncbi:hypothetical protein [Campylobacter ureolyticus]|uniref:Uncharacterized protein n=1 Tax=Campylobacter ureolyticus TaxID=827 RepID=A0A6N2TC52_9BACT
MIYNIYNTGRAYRLAFWTCMIPCSIMLFLIFKFYEYIFNYHIISSNMSLLLGIGIFYSIVSIIVFCTNLKYSVDLDSRKINLPASNVKVKSSFLKNLLYSFLVLLCLITPLILFVWIPLCKRTSIDLEEVENVYVDTKNWSSGKGKDKKNYTRYNVYVVGTFGSAHIEFDSRLERDEFRNAVRQGINYCKNPNNRKMDEEI